LELFSHWLLLESAFRCGKVDGRVAQRCERDDATEPSEFVVEEDGRPKACPELAEGTKGGRMMLTLFIRQIPSRTIRLVQIVWLVLVVTNLALFILGGLVYFRELETICAGTRLECHDRSLATPEDVAQLQQEGITLRDWAIANTAYRSVIAFLFCGIGLVIFARKHNEWNGLLFSYFLIAFGTISGNYQALANSYPVLTTPVNIIGLGAYISFALFFASFPDGRIVPRVMWIPVSLWSISFFLNIFFDLPARGTPINNVQATVVWLGMLIGGLLAQAYRYWRVSHAEERQQTKWVVFGIAILVIGVVTIFFSPLGSQFGDAEIYSRANLFGLIVVNLLVTLIPITIGIAILRSRLFDIDIIIRRTLIYSILTAMLALFYFGSVVVLQQILRPLIGAESDLAIIISTLAIAALFNPLRRRVQDTIDHRFYRRKYDAQQVLAKFGATARDEVELEKLTGELLNVVNETMQPTSVSLWLKKTENRKLVLSSPREQGTQR
jgi:hypothetical protein